MITADADVEFADSAIGRMQEEEAARCPLIHVGRRNGGSLHAIIDDVAVIDPTLHPWFESFLELSVCHPVVAHDVPATTRVRQRGRTAHIDVDARTWRSSPIR
jgi:hypothetical protein